jgi:hypothetical protein
MFQKPVKAEPALGRLFAAPILAILLAIAAFSATAAQPAGDTPAKTPKKVVKPVSPLPPQDPEAAVWAEVKPDACPTNQTTDLGGLSPFLCHKGIGAMEFATSCLYMVTYKGTDKTQLHRDYGCTESCPGPDWKIDVDCKSKGVFPSFNGKVYMRNYDALPADAQKELSDDYTTLLALVNADNAKNTAAYAKLGGDAKRKEVKQDIVKVVFDQMIPFAWATRDSADPVQWYYKQAYSGVPVGGGSGVVPNEWSGASNFLVYESLLYTKDKAGNPHPESINMLAAALLHEFLIHARQYNHGNATASAQQLFNLMNVEDDLSEIVAYTVSLQDPFYQFALTDAQRAEIGTNDLNDKISDFKKNWAVMPPEVKKRAATYAWFCSGYMKSQMTRANVLDFGGGGLALLNIVPGHALQASPWTELCTAIPAGQGICHIVGSKPDDPECLTKSFF